VKNAKITAPYCTEGLRKEAWNFTTS